MKQTVFFLFVGLICVVLLAKGSFAAKEPIKYGARDSVLLGNSHSLIKLYGQAYLFKGDVRIVADYIEFNRTDSTVTTKGHTVFSNYHNKFTAISENGVVFKLRDLNK